MARIKASYSVFIREQYFKLSKNDFVAYMQQNDTYVLDRAAALAWWNKLNKEIADKPKVISERPVEVKKDVELCPYTPQPWNQKFVGTGMVWFNITDGSFKTAEYIAEQILGDLCRNNSKELEIQLEGAKRDCEGMEKAIETYKSQIKALQEELNEYQEAIKPFKKLFNVINK